MRYVVGLINASFLNCTLCVVSRARPSGERWSGDYCQHSVDSAGMLALPIRLQHLPIIALMEYLTPCVLNIEPSLTKPRLRGLTGAAPREARANGIIQHRSPDTYLASTPSRSPSSPLWTAGTHARTQRVKYFVMIRIPQIPTCQGILPIVTRRNFPALRLVSETTLCVLHFDYCIIFSVNVYTPSLPPLCTPLSVISWTHTST